MINVTGMQKAEEVRRLMENGSMRGTMAELHDYLPPVFRPAFREKRCCHRTYDRYRSLRYGLEPYAVPPITAVAGGAGSIWSSRATPSRRAKKTAEELFE